MACSTNPSVFSWLMMFIIVILASICIIVFDAIIIPKLKRKQLAKLVTYYNALTSEYTDYFDCYPKIQCTSNNEKDCITGLYSAFSADENSECGLVIKGFEYNGY